MTTMEEITSPAAFYLIRQLKKLMTLPLVTLADLDQWNDEADKVDKTRRDAFPNFQPQDIYYHYLSDPDIRIRDKGYLEYQHKLVLEYIDHLLGKKRLRRINALKFRFNHYSLSLFAPA